jgi:hypothetical protein
MLACRDAILKVLAAQQRPRDHSDDGWLHRELAAVHDAAHRWALANGYEPTVTISDVESIDRMSTGADWGSKVALRVARQIVQGA